MNKEIISDALEKAHCALNPDRSIIGVRFLFDAAEFEQAAARPLSGKMPFCVMAKRAMSGKSLKAVFENFGCLSSARALGIIAPDEMFSSGRHYRRLGLYQDLVISKNVRQQMSLCQHQAFGVCVKPLDAFCNTPDVILLVTKPYRAMRIVQAYTYKFGYQTTYKMSGNQAICSECTAYPFENNCINVSLLCSGTRRMCGWRDDELAVGLPFNKFAAVMDGLFATANPTEPDKKKSAIAQRLLERGRKDLTIQYGHNYYSGLYLNQPDRENS